MQNTKEIINAQQSYIEFLEKDIQRNAGFLYAYNIITPKEIVDEGIRLRKSIADLKAKSIT